MEQNFQTSFIPKKPIVKETVVSSGRPVGFVMVISILILFAVILVTGGLYFYKQSLAKNVASLETSLSVAKSQFEPDRISDLQALDKRLSASEQILSNHVTINPIFDALSAVTLKSVRYTKFNYDSGSGQGAMVDVRMSGIATDYGSIALQADLFANNKNLLNAVFSNLALDTNGNVSFDLEFFVNPSFVNYKQNLSAQS